MFKSRLEFSIHSNKSISNNKSFCVEILYESLQDFIVFINFHKTFWGKSRNEFCVHINKSIANNKSCYESLQDFIGFINSFEGFCGKTRFEFCRNNSQFWFKSRDEFIDDINKNAQISDFK